MNQKRFRMSSMALLFTVVIVCVAVFSALTVVTAAQDLRLSRQYATRVQEFYDCEALGHQWLAQVEQGTMPEGTWQEEDRLGVKLETDTMYLEICVQQTAQGLEIQQWSCSAKWQPQADWNLWQ